MKFIITATDENLGNTDSIKANYYEYQVNKGKWSYVRPRDLQLMNSHFDQEQNN